LKTGSGAPALASLDAVLASGVAHEIRTTVRHVIQAFRSQGCANAGLVRGARIAPDPANAV
jgi:methylmalonyl-CoA mutase cobalamin-binding subunit